MTSRLASGGAAVTGVEAFAGGLGFVPDPFQLRSMEALRDGRSVVVAAPTGSGKTLVAEYGVGLAREGGLRSFYTTPLKALSNQKFQDLSRRHGTDNVGLLTGDHSIRPDAPIVVMTTEVLRNMLYSDPASTRRVGVVVLDEVHYLQDPYRGGVWEEVIIHLPRDIALVCLSATVSNAEEFAGWVETLRGDTVAVIEERRPVPLAHHYCVAKGARQRLMPLFGDTPEAEDDAAPDAPALNPRIVRLEGGSRRGGWRASGLRTPRRHEVVDLLAERGMLPAIYFIFSRVGCDRAVQQILDEGVRLTSKREREDIRRRIMERTADVPRSDLAALGFGRWLSGLQAGLAAHHAGMVPAFREAVEELFLCGLVKLVFATETLSLGVNMPARTVVIEKLTKFGGERHEALTPGQYTQLAGRAGRRGIDDHGNAVVLWSPFVPYEDVAQLASARTYELVSSFRPTYNMAANLVSRVDRDRAHHIVNSSFAQFQSDKIVVQLEAQARRYREAAAAYRGRASCERCGPGDLDDYITLREAVARGRDVAGGGPQRRRSAPAPRPGDVVVLNGRPVAIVRRGGRGGRQYRYVGADGRLLITSADRLGGVVARLGMPEPFRPGDRGFRTEMARRLRATARQLDAGTIAAAKRRPAVGGGDAAAALEEHPCRECPDLDEKTRWVWRARVAERDLERIEARIRRRSESLSRRFDGVCDFLEAIGYLDGWALTRKGLLLARIYSECDLAVAETLAAEVFGGLDAASLGAALSVFTFEARREGATAPLPAAPGLRTAVARSLEITAKLRNDERARDLDVLRDLDDGFCGQAFDWARGQPLEDVLVDEIAGGDFVRNVKQLVDMLRQVAEGTRHSGIAVSVAEPAREAADAMWRGVIAATAVKAEDDGSDDGMTSGRTSPGLQGGRGAQPPEPR